MRRRSLALSIASAVLLAALLIGCQRSAQSGDAGTSSADKTASPSQSATAPAASPGATAPAASDLAALTDVDAKLEPTGPTVGELITVADFESVLGAQGVFFGCPT
ncbi:MAG: hypothetical protein AB2L09_11265 [Coriobacteriia bacterium]